MPHPPCISLLPHLCADWHSHCAVAFPMAMRCSQAPEHTSRIAEAALNITGGALFLTTIGYRPGKDSRGLDWDGGCYWALTDGDAALEPGTDKWWTRFLFWFCDSKLENRWTLMMLLLRCPPFPLRRDGTSNQWPSLSLSLSHTHARTWVLYFIPTLCWQIVCATALFWWRHVTTTKAKRLLLGQASKTISTLVLLLDSLRNTFTTITVGWLTCTAVLDEARSGKHARTGFLHTDTLTRLVTSLSPVINLAVWTVSTRVGSKIPHLCWCAKFRWLIIMAGPLDFPRREAWTGVEEWRVTGRADVQTNRPYYWQGFSGCNWFLCLGLHLGRTAVKERVEQKKQCMGPYIYIPPSIYIQRYQKDKINPLWFF